MLHGHTHTPSVPVWCCVVVGHMQTFIHMSVIHMGSTHVETKSLRNTWIPAQGILESWILRLMESKHKYTNTHRHTHTHTDTHRRTIITLTLWRLLLCFPLLSPDQTLLLSPLSLSLSLSSFLSSFLFSVSSLYSSAQSSLFIYPSIYLPIHLSIYRSVNLPFPLCQSALSLFLSFSPSVLPSSAAY